LGRNMELAITSSDIAVDSINLEVFQRLKAVFPDESDEELARFLIARNHDYDKTEEMLKAHLIWRAKNMPVSKASCLNEFSKGKLFMHGYDNEGHPLLIWRSSLHEAADRDMDEMVRLILWWFQYMSTIMPPNKSKITLLCDRSDYRSANSDLEFVKAASNVLQDNFPERLHRAVIYPTGLVFYGLWNVVKWFLDPVTQSKVAPCVYASGVTSYIDSIYIPTRMGGTSDYEFDPDHFCDPPLEGDAKATADTEEEAVSK